MVQKVQEEQISLSPRLQGIADWVPKQSRFGDIGTDHGYLPLYLLQTKGIASAIATDISQGPLDTAKRMAEKYQNPMDFRLCDGLSGVKEEEVDCVSITGMGGITISAILRGWSSTWKGTFLLQPMSAQKELRQWLNQNQFTIQEERTILEGETLYTLMRVCCGGDSPYRPEELLLGRMIVCQEDANRDLLMTYHLKKIEKIQIQLDQAHPKYKELEAEKEAIEKMRQEWSKWNQSK